MSALKTENEELKVQLQSSNPSVVLELEKTNAELNAKYDQLKSSLTDQIRDHVLKREVDLRKEMSQKIDLFKDAEHDLNRQILNLKNELATLQSSYQHSQTLLLHSNQSQGDKIHGKNAEFELILADLEKHRFKVAQLEKENVILSS